MAAWSRKTLKMFEKCLLFWKNDPYGKILKILFRSFSSRHRSTCCVQISWNLAEGKSVISYTIYLEKKQTNKQNFVWLSSCRYCTPCTDRTRNLPRPVPEKCSQTACARFNPNRFTFGGVIAKRVNTAKMHRKVNPIFGWSLASNRIIKSLLTVFSLCLLHFYSVSHATTVVYKHLATFYLHTTLKNDKPSASTSLIMSCNSASVGFCPSDLITVPSSLVVIVPSPSLSNSENASLNSAIHIFFLFFDSVSCARLSWLSRQLLSARKYTLSYRIFVCALS